MCDDMCLGCDICETPEPVKVGDTFKDRGGRIVWTVIGFDKSGQGAVLRGDHRGIRTAPLNQDGAMRENNHLFRA